MAHDGRQTDDEGAAKDRRRQVGPPKTRRRAIGAAQEARRQGRVKERERGEDAMTRWRHFVVAVGVVPVIVLYVWLAIWLLEFAAGIHVVIDLVIFMVAGLAWIPLAGAVVGWLAKHESH